MLQGAAGCCSLCVAAMVSIGMTAGYRSGEVRCLLCWLVLDPSLTRCCTDDLQDTRYFMELVGSVPAEPLPMQILAMAHNAGKANQVSSCRITAAEPLCSKHLDWPRSLSCKCRMLR